MRHRVLILIIALLVVSIGSTIGVLAYRSRQTTVRSLNEQRDALTQFAVGTVEIGLSTGRIDAVLEFLNELSANPLLAGAIIYDADADALMGVPDGFHIDEAIEELVLAGGNVVEGDFAYQSAILEDEGEVIGYLLLVVSFESINREAKNALVFTVFIGLAVLLPVTIIIAWVLTWMEKKLRKRELRLAEANSEIELMSVALREEKTAAEATATEAQAEKQYLAESVDTMLQSMARFAEGDLTVSLPSDADGVIGELFRGFNRTVSNLRGVLEQIQNNATTVASASSRIRVASEKMATAAGGTSERVLVVSAASEQAGVSVRSVSAAAEEMSASIAEVTKTLGRALEISREGTRQAQGAVALVDDLSRSAEEIGEVLKVISKVTKQTNLLALNATIEAARAGEAGSRFAVVAKEVKNLASDTAAAAELIGQKIRGVQENTGSAVDSIKQIDGIIERIYGITDELAAEMEQQSLSTQEIARNVTEAARGTEEVSESMGDVAQAASETAGGASENLEASEELAGVAAQLRDVASGFSV